MAKPITALELHYPMIQFVINSHNRDLDCLRRRLLNPEAPYLENNEMTAKIINWKQRLDVL